MYSKDKKCDLTSLKPQPVSVWQLCDDCIKFYIPAYQRGYKWGIREVVALLKDLDRFSAITSDSFYCLQPIVVRYDANANIWRVVDGQQRLTTIYIILKAINEYEENNLQSFDIEYQRKGNLNRLSDRIDNSGSEIFHLTQAYSIVSDWIKNEHKRTKLKTVLINSTKFIWYNLVTIGEVEAEALKIEHEFFLNLNSGKIALTEAELIKALLLHSEVKNTKKESLFRQIFQAEEWDRMEKSLRQPEIWYFIAGRETFPANAMDFLLNLLWESLPESEKLKYKNIDFPIFEWAEEKGATSVWKDLTNVYRRIMGWYQNNETHNLIGYFAAKRGNKKYISSYVALFRQNDRSSPNVNSHSEFLKILWRDAITDDNLICSDDELNTELPVDLRIGSYTYSQYEKVFNILFLTNIIHCTLSNKSKGSQRFDFVQFNDPSMPWNVEHISPANPKDNDQILKRLNEFISDTIDLCSIPDDIIKFRELLIKINAVKDKEQTVENILGETDFKTYTKLKISLLPTEEDDTFPLRNLTLLTERCNKGIGNKFFFDKRQRLRIYQAEGQFIPQLTQNVFSKWYSKSSSSPLFWTEEDREDYQTAINELCLRAINHVRKLQQ